jgi:hypothetical protein
MTHGDCITFNVEMHRLLRITYRLEALMLLIEGNSDRLDISGLSLAELFRPISDDLFEVCEKLQGLKVAEKAEA